MKLPSSLLTCLLALGAAAALAAQDIKLNLPAGQAATPPPPAVDPATPPAIAATPPTPAYTETQVLEVVGWFMARNTQIDTFELTPAQTDSVVRGFAGYASGRPPSVELKQIGPQVQEFVRLKSEAYVAKLRQKGMQETAAFLAEIKKKPGVIVTPSGLCYEIVAPGEGPNPKPTDTLTAHCVGLLVNGTEFLNSLKMQQGQPIEFQLDQVIPGWTEGLQKIAKGGKIKLYVPPHLAYGDDGRQNIPPGSTLIFEIQILEIKATPPAPATPAPAGK